MAEVCSGFRTVGAQVYGSSGVTGTCSNGRIAEFLLSHNRDMVTLDTLRVERREEILRLAARRGARSLRVFGSVARNEANENSDLDLLVVWEPGRSLMDHAGLVQDLQDLLGVKVHVGTEKSLHWYVRGRILGEATPL